MKRITKLTQSGFDHVLVPIFVVVAFGLVGSFLLIESHAATPSGIQLASAVNSNASCLDDYAQGGKVPGPNTIDLWSCNKTVAQSWTLSEATNTTTGGTITNNNGLCLDILNASKANYAGVDLYKCNGQSNQKWYVSGTKIVNPISGRCLDDYHSLTANKNTIDIFTCNGTNAQKWTASAIAAAPVPKTASPNDTVVPNDSSSSIVDSAGTVWTVTGGVIHKNGTADTATSNVLEIAYVSGVVWQENNLNYWWSWTGTAWTPDSNIGLTTSPLPSSGGTTGGGGVSKGGGTAGFGQPVMTPPIGTRGQYTTAQEIWQDNFSGTSLDTTHWSTVMGGPSPIGAWDGFSNAGGTHVVVNNGLTLINDSGQATAGAVDTMNPNTQQYLFKFPSNGFFIQVKEKTTDTSQGFWPAIWFPSSTSTPGSPPEMDMLEGGFVGHGSVNDVSHIDFGGGASLWAGYGENWAVSPDLTQNFTTYGLEWIPGVSATFYVNGVQVFQQLASKTGGIPATANYNLVLTPAGAPCSGSGNNGWHTCGVGTGSMYISGVQVYSLP
jgi:hypothetical protein